MAGVQPHETVGPQGHAIVRVRVDEHGVGQRQARFVLDEGGRSCVVDLYHTAFVGTGLVLGEIESAVLTDGIRVQRTQVYARHLDLQLVYQGILVAPVIMVARDGEQRHFQLVAHDHAGMAGPSNDQVPEQLEIVDGCVAIGLRPEIPGPLPPDALVEVVPDVVNDVTG